MKTSGWLLLLFLLLSSRGFAQPDNLDWFFEFNATGFAFDGASYWAVDPLDKKFRQFESPANEPYHPFPEDHAAWHTMGDNMFSEEIWIFRYALSGDTLIDDVAYRKVVELADTLINDPANTFFAAIRENDQKQVFVRFPGFEEALLYDFGLEINDTIWFDIGGGLCYDGFGFWEETHYKVVVAIDSLMLENGEYRKSWTLTTEYGAPTTWVEGIGSIDWYGLFNPFISAYALCGDNYQFVCFKHNDTVLFLDNPYCESCFCDFSSSVPALDSHQASFFEVFPNPSEGVLSLRLTASLPGPCYIELYDMAGQSILSALPFDGDCTLSLEHYPRGLYLIRMLDGRGRPLQTRKIVLK